MTLVMGERYGSLWRTFARDSWLAYADRHRLDVIAIDRPIDDSPRARKRSPAWQKLLILGQDFATKYDRLVWVDSDIVMNPAAPLVTDGVPIERIGAVDEFSLPSPTEHALAVERIGRAGGLGRDRVWFTASAYYESWGLPATLDQVVQTGVLVMSPKHHREILEHVYHSYEDRGDAIWHYEMRPLSYELLRGNLVNWIDRRFNSLWAYDKAVHYPWLLRDPYPVLRKHRGARRLALMLDEARLRRPLAVALTNSYFLHFASTPFDVLALHTSSRGRFRWPSDARSR